MSNVRGFSVSWASNPNALGTKPPHPQFQPDNLPSEVTPMMNLPSPAQSGTMPVGLIQSGRQPFAVEHAYTKYGELSTRLGTNLGK